MYKAAVVTEWRGSGQTGDPFRPQVCDEYDVVRWEDITGQPAQNLTPQPNEYTVLIECDGATLAAIDASNDYLILWWEA